MVVVHVGIENGGPPFRHGQIQAHRDPGIFPPADIPVPDDGCMILLLESFGEEICRFALVKRSRQEIAISVGNFEIV